MSCPALNEQKWTNMLLRAAGCLEQGDTLLVPMSQLSKILYEKLIYIRNGTSLQVVKKVIGKVLWYLQCQHLASLLYFSYPATVTMALLSGSPIWSGISKKRRMNPEWRSLMRKRCHTSPLTSPWKTRSIEMGNTEMISKWTELGWICMNWDTFLQSFFFLSPFPNPFENLCCSFGYSVYVFELTEAVFHRTHILFILFFTRLLSHLHLQTLGDAGEESCFQQPLAGSRAVSSTWLGSSGYSGDSAFVGTYWHLLVLGRRAHPCSESEPLLRFQKSYFPLKSSTWLTPSPSCSPSVWAESWPVVLVCFSHTGRHLPTECVSPRLSVLWSQRSRMLLLSFLSSPVWAGPGGFSSASNSSGPQSLCVSQQYKS